MGSAHGDPAHEIEARQDVDDPAEDSQEHRRDARGPPLTFTTFSHMSEGQADGQGQLSSMVGHEIAAATAADMRTPFNL